MAGFSVHDRAPLPVLAYAVYLHLSGLSLRREDRALQPFADGSHEAVGLWIHRLSSLSAALHPGKARVAVVDEMCVRASSSRAWAWLVMDPGVFWLSVSAGPGMA